MEKYYYNGPNATGVLKVAKGSFVKYGDEIPGNIEKGIIEDFEKRGLITKEKSLSTEIHNLEKENASKLELFEKKYKEAEKQNEKLIKKNQKLIKEAAVFAEQISSLEKENADLKEILEKESK